MSIIKNLVEPLNQVNSEILSHGFNIEMTASPYFDGLITHQMSRIPYLVGVNLKHSLEEFETYYKYHFQEYTFLYFEVKDTECTIYFHSEMNGLVFHEISWSSLLAFLDDS